jgi:hypothetical protein
MMTERGVTFRDAIRSVQALKFHPKLLQLPFSLLKCCTYIKREPASLPKPPADET